MKIAFYILALFGPFFLNAQDKLVKKNNETITCKVLKIGPELIEFQKWSDGPVYSIYSSEVDSILFENGVKEKIKAAQKQASQKPSAGLADPGRHYSGRITTGVPSASRPRNGLNFNLLLLGFDHVSFAYERRGEKFGLRIPVYYNYSDITLGLAINPRLYLNRHPVIQAYFGPEVFVGYNDLYRVAALGTWGNLGISINPIPNLNFSIGIALGHLQFTEVTTPKDDGLIKLPELSFGLNF